MVGGTKDLRPDDIAALGADIVILDREENPKAFTDQITSPWLATHVEGLAGLERELRRLARELRAPGLAREADRADRLLQSPPLKSAPGVLPGLIEELSPWSPDKEILYVIWKDPWMAAGAGTYIDDVLARLGFRRRAGLEGRYPRLTEAELSEAYPLYSSEPFPFAKKRDGLRAGAIVDGEGFSWFGSRGLDFLEAATRLR